MSGTFEGAVANFNDLKGWGFVTLADGSGDAFFMRDECPEGRAFSAQPGDAVVFDSLDIGTNGKPRAKGVRKAIAAAGCGDFASDIAALSAGMLTGTIANFNPMNGWGFISIPGQEDAFFVRDDCAGGRAFTASPGDLVCFDALEDRDGRKKCAKGVRVISSGSTSSSAGGFGNLITPTNFGGAVAGSGLQEGTVSSFNNLKGWGFLTTAQGEDAFFIRDETLEGRMFQASTGDVVLYETVEVREDGKRRATGVRLSASAGPAASGGLQATICSFNPIKGWGFVTLADGTDCFFIRDECPEGPGFSAQAGEVVCYDSIEQRADGKRRAKGVRTLHGMAARSAMYGGCAQAPMPSMGFPMPSMGYPMPGGGSPPPTSGRGMQLQSLLNGGQPGKISSFNNEKGWGFITTKTGEDFFFIRDECMEGRAFTAKPGDPVVYDCIEMRPDGKRRARGVRLLSTVLQGAGGASNPCIAGFLAAAGAPGADGAAGPAAKRQRMW